MNSLFRRFAALAATVSLLLAATPAPAQDASASADEAAPPAEGQSAPTPEEMEAFMMEMAQPAPEHANLAPLVGSWRYTSTMTMGVNEETGESLSMRDEGTAEATWILGGRFVQFTSKSDPDSQFPSESMHTYGFDRRTGKYTVWGMDTMGTYAVPSQGTYDAEKKAFTFETEFDMPPVGATTFRWIVTVESEDRIRQEIFFRGADGTWPETPHVVAVQERIAEGEATEAAAAAGDGASSGSN